MVGDGPTPRILRTMTARSSRRPGVQTRTLEMLSSEFDGPAPAKEPAAQGLKGKAGAAADRGGAAKGGGDGRWTGAGRGRPGRCRDGGSSVPSDESAPLRPRCGRPPPCYAAAPMSDRPTFEFHVSRAARDLYGFDDALFSVTGNVVFANLEASRAFAHRMNTVREAERHPERAVSPGALNAMGLIDEILHARRGRLPRAAGPARDDRRARPGSRGRLGRAALGPRPARASPTDFPTVPVYRGELTAASWLARRDGGTSRTARWRSRS